MKTRMSAVSGLVLLACAATFPGAAFATWSSYTDDGTHYGIREGDNKIPLNVSEKEATRTAHKVNKALGKDKPDEGVVDAPGSPCHDPSTGVVC
jgi:hypothetical protein